jgi:hypothetical protein
MLVSDDDDTSSRAEGYFELRLPRRRLYCRCGHQLTAYDFDILEPTLCVRSAAAAILIFSRSKSGEAATPMLTQGANDEGSTASS